MKRVYFGIAESPALRVLDPLDFVQVHDFQGNRTKRRELARSLHHLG
jgi:hypothetical protein